MPFARQTIKSPTGADICLYKANWQAEPKSIVHINHGMAEHAARYERFAAFLSQKNIMVYAHDHRGHGWTKAPDAPLGQFGGRDGLDKVLGDIEFVNAHIHSEYPGKPVVVFGHSMGATLTLAYAMRNPQTADGVAVWNAATSTGLLFRIGQMLLKAERMLKGSDVPSRLAQKLTFETWNKSYAPNRTDFDWLSRDEAEVDKYVADPLCGFPVSVGMWLQLMDAIIETSDNANLEPIPRSKPFNLAAGAHDPVSEKGEGILALGRRLQSAGFTDVTTTIYPEIRHEGLNDVNRDTIMTDFRDWMEERFG